ncbi:two-component system sensor histidine kinase NtrB [Psychrobacter phenylpyruvicus]|uniref:histidine kinase n=1 Tax=Psychrobacter phenylpyruvicus TaxID=29432 RepID=A0A379LJY3_9GAMM|nr:ATP-binding protein [Psychrobacter phenylpyruvicus]SUD90197.1 Nitrogen regulation protein NR(II) [Psychrobacter phenylpyruvicus]
MKQLQAVSLLQNLYTGVIWVTEDLTIQWVNSQTEQLLSVSKSRLEGLSILDLLMPTMSQTKVVAPDSHTPHSSNPSAESETQLSENKSCLQASRDKLEIQFHNAKEYLQPFIEYSRHIRGITQPLYVHYSVTPMIQQGKFYYLVEIWQGDRQSRLDKEQRLQEQHDVSREMLRSVAHEVKNPLAGIRGAAQLLIKQTQHSPDHTYDNENTVLVDAKKLTTYASIVISETDRLTKLIEQLLGSNQLPEWQEVNIHEPLEHILLLIQSQYPQVTIKRDYDLSLPEITADKNQLIQVFLNLANNACEALLEQDTALLAADYQPELTVVTRIEHQYTIGAQHHRQVIRVSIQDNGAGIADDLIERIFFPLVTGRANGTGLGLALVQEIIHRHEGTIEVSSQPGDTQFNVYLPLQISNLQSH